MTGNFDIAVVGSGFGGALMAMIAQRLGYRTLLLERGRHPRFAIGESASPLAGILIEQLADRYDLPRIRPLSAFGPWQRAYPTLVCGLKRGFTYFRHQRGESYRARPDRANQLLVAASPTDELSDTHWLRSDVDHFLVGEAIAAGVEYVDEIQLDGLEHRGEHCVLNGGRRGAAVTIRAAFVIDASGPNGFISRALNINDRGFPGSPQTQALFSHFTGVVRCDAMAEFAVHRSDALSQRGAVADAMPYPMDDAALHHVFDGGWMWVLRFGSGVTSAGIAVTDALARELRLGEGEAAWHRFLALYPSIAAQFADAQPIREFTWMPRLTWRVERAAGPRWAMLPSAAAFIDPLFSTGIPLTLLGIERLGRILERSKASIVGSVSADDRASAPVRALDAYAETTLSEADHTARFIAGCYAAFPSFEQFAAYSMFYFAAASYSEMSRRLGTNAGHGRFLAADRTTFADALVRLSPQRSLPGASYADQIARAIDPLNIAGLCDPRKRNWYPVHVRDVVRGAAKLGVDRVVRYCSNPSHLMGAKH